MKDLVIIGAGPAGLSAGVYAVRSGLDTEIIESNYMPGGQVLTTYEVDNYLGFNNINGFDLALKYKEHLEHMGLEIKSKTVKNIKKQDDHFIITLNKDTIESKAIILATGAENKKLNVKGENEFSGRGVSYCATCDGAFFKNKTVAVIGGSYVAVEDAIYLASLCQKVYLIHRRDKLRAGSRLENKLMSLSNVEIIWNSNCTEIIGNEVVKSINVKNNDGTHKNIDLNAVFIAVGTTPKTDLVKDLVNLDENGYIIANEDCKSSLDGLFVAGDLRTKHLRQIVTAVSDGANAATSAWNYILDNKEM